MPEFGVKTFNPFKPGFISGGSYARKHRETSKKPIQFLFIFFFKLIACRHIKCLSIIQKKSGNARQYNHQNGVYLNLPAPEGEREKYKAERNGAYCD